MQQGQAKQLACVVGVDNEAMLSKRFAVMPLVEALGRWDFASFASIGSSCCWPSSGGGACFFGGRGSRKRVCVSGTVLDDKRLAISWLHPVCTRVCTARLSLASATVID
jgi:hypothetical protein